MMVYATTFLAYPKDHMFALRPTCILHVVLDVVHTGVEVCRMDLEISRLVE